MTKLALSMSLTGRILALCAPTPVSRPRAAAVRVLLGALALAAASRLQVPFIGTPVPFTLGPQAAIFLGASLGPWEGAGAVAAWLASGLGGAPVFASGLVGVPALLAPSGGFALAYLPAAFFAGFARRAPHVGALIIWLVASWLILMVGTAGLAVHLGIGPALEMGVAPFFATDAYKTILLCAAWLMGRKRLRAH